MTLSTMDSPPGVAVIGSGYWGKNLVRNLYNLKALKLICDKNEELLAQFEKQYPGVETCMALNEVIASDKIKGILIATPAETHYTIAREALFAGKHVYSEKPLSLSQKEGEDLISLADEHGLILMVGHLLQYHPVFVRLKELAGSGELGRINYIYSHRMNLGKIRREENILWSFAPHDISMILSLAGEEPEGVFATGGNYLHKKIADVTTTHMVFPNGVRAHILVSWLHPFKEQKLVVVGDKKMAVFDDTLPWEDKLFLYPHEITWQNNVPIASKAEAERLDIAQDEPLRLECEHFLECIATGQQSLTDGREGLRVLKVLNASQQCLDAEAYGQATPWQVRSDKDDAFNSPSSAATIDSVAQDYFVHESAAVDDNVVIKDGTRIWHFSHIMFGSIIGYACNIGQNVVIGPDVSIGNGCKIQNNVSVYKGVTLEDGVFCGPSMVFTNIAHPRAEIRKMDQVRSTLVRKGTTIGANATIICGVTLGRYSFIGAGSVVIADVPDHALMVGNPARQIGWVCTCGERLDEKFICPSCKTVMDCSLQLIGSGL